MLTVYSKRHIRFQTIETPTARIIVAILVETYGNETFTSAPKVVRIIPKTATALKGNVSTGSFNLGAPKASVAFSKRIVSPYTADFSYKNIDTLSSYFARPPTV